MTPPSIKNNRNNRSLLKVWNVVAAVTFVLGALHLVSLSTASRGATLESSTINEVSTILTPVHDQQISVVAPLNSRRQLLATTIASKIGPLVSAKYGWQNDHNIVHVVNTRFMQHQPALEHLGMARLDLFKTFALPSMLQQGNQQFLWIIWTDPHLQGQVRDELLKSIVQIPNVLVLAAYNEQNDNLRTLYGYSLSEIKETILSGDIDLLASYQEASHSHVLVETDLDADDAFSRTFVETAQAQAALSVGHDFRMNSKHSETFCPEYHAEWRFFGVNGDNEIGELVHFHDENFCIRSGMTVVYNTHAEARRLSPCNNHDTSKCCPTWATRNTRFLSEVVAVEHDHKSDETSAADNKVGIVPVWVNEDAGIFSGEMFNTANFFTDHRELLLSEFDNKYWFSDKTLWLNAVKGCCIAEEEFKDDIFLPPLEIISSNGFVRNTTKVDYFFDVLSFNATTTITFEGGMYAMGGEFNLVDVGGAGAGVNIYIDVAMDGKDSFHLPGQTRGFFGFVSKNKVHKVEFSVGPTGPRPNYDALSEEFVIQWLQFAFPPEVPCRRSLRTLPDSENDSAAETKSLEAAVLMSRTPTAAGMKNVLPGKVGGGKNSIALTTYDEDQEQAWEYMEYNFGVRKETVADVHHRMEDDMESILVDAFAGQCTPGHSCKESTKSALGYLLDKERLRDFVDETN